MRSSIYSNFDMLDNNSDQSLWEFALLPFRNTEGKYAIVRSENGELTDDPLTFEDAKLYISAWLKGEHEEVSDKLN